MTTRDLSLRTIAFARAWKAFAEDAAGHEHKGKGLGGGQFTAGHGGSSAEKADKPIHADAMEAHAAKLAREDYAKNGTKAKAFKTWFGDSKVVDDKGEPLTVHHGTAKTFDQFKKDTKNAWSDTLGIDTYFFAGNKATASTYAKQSKKGKILNVYLSLQNPLIIDMNGGEWPDAIVKASELLQTYRTPEEKEFLEAKKAFYNKYAYESEYEPWNVPHEAEQELSAAARKLQDHILDNKQIYRSAKQVPFGYDGIIVKDVMDSTAMEPDTDETGSYNPFTTVYIAFEPTQIKAVGNAGTFDPANPSINLAESADDAKAVQPASTS